MTTKELLDAARARRKLVAAELTTLDMFINELDGGSEPKKKSSASDAMRKAWATRKANATKAAKKTASLAEAAAD